MMFPMAGRMIFLFVMPLFIVLCPVAEKEKHNQQNS
jgi:hypothetical protein